MWNIISDERLLEFKIITQKIQLIKRRIKWGYWMAKERANHYPCKGHATMAI